jgi:L-ascorbate metabolism protein UlaG (beta-lactamase superfamily)
LIVPPGSGRFFERRGFDAVSELKPGESTAVGDLTVTAVDAHHDGGKRRFAPEPGAIGFLVDGDRKIYFAGDTDYFPEMEELGPDLDLALLPIWGWGPSIGEGHLDPEGAAHAAGVLSPRLAVPIHWGTLYPFGLRRLRSAPLRKPAERFTASLERLAPQVEARVLSPGESTPLA